MTPLLEYLPRIFCYPCQVVSRYCCFDVVLAFTMVPKWNSVSLWLRAVVYWPNQTNKKKR